MAFALGGNAAMLSARAAFGSRRALSAQAPPPPAARCSLSIEASMKRKKWEHKEVNPTTGKPVLRKLHVHTGDQVIIIAGADKGVISEVTYVNRATGQIGVKNVDLSAGVGKQRKDGQPVRQESKFQSCQVSPVTKDGKPSRIRHEIIDGKKRRVLVKSGEVMPL